MPWRVENVKNKPLGFVAFVFAIGSFLVCGTALPAMAVDSKVEVTVCGSVVPSASIDITQPLNDSVVDRAVTTFRGTVAHAAQIEIEINGQYNSTIAVAVNSASFETDVTLPNGTSTVMMTANSICGGQDSSDSVVVTFQPATEPSSGGTTPTIVDGAVTLEGSPINPEVVEKDDIAGTVRRLPVIGAAVSAVSDFASMIGLEATVTGNDTTAVAGAARVVLTVAALSSIVMAGSAAPLAAQAVPGLAELFNVQSHRSMLYLGWIIRGVGLVALAMAYFI